MTRSALALLLVCLPACSAPADGPDGTSGSTGSASGLTEAADGSSSSGASSTGAPCPVGSLECPCTDGGFCDAPLVCEAGTCVQGCAIGSLSCACTMGGTCDGGLTCDAGVCVEGVSETCGDGQVDEFEECDAGEGNADTGSCTSVCKLAVCGDGKLGPGEACDGGEACTSACALSSCGDGELDPGEDCEPAGEGDLECTAKCTDARKVIFVTSEHYKGGEIGGVAGADEKCQTLAAAAGLPGKFLAFIADSEDNVPLKRFTWHDGVPFVDIAGEVLADDWHYYTGNIVGLVPALTEMGEKAAASELELPERLGGGLGNYSAAWSSTPTSTGVFLEEARDCGKWAGGALGTAIRLGAPFKAAWGSADCSRLAPILCWEQ